MITAQEARERTNELIKNYQLEDIEKKILKAIEDRYVCITVNSLSEETKEELESLGYVVKHYSGDYMTDESWDISW